MRARCGVRWRRGKHIENKTKKAMASFLTRFSGKPNILYWPQRCMVHQIFRTITMVLERIDCIRPLSCVSSVLHLATRQAALAASITHLVKARFRYLPGMQPPPDDAPSRLYAQAVCTHLLLNRVVRDDPSKIFETPAEELVSRRIERLQQLSQGPWWMPDIVHYCPGAGCICGGDAAKALIAVTEVIMWVILFSRPDAPTFARWTTLGPYVGWFTMSMLLHGIFTSAWLHAFGSEPVVEV